MIDIALSESRVLRLRIIDSLVELEVGTISARSVHENWSLGGGGHGHGHSTDWRVARTSESFVPGAVLTFPLRSLGDVRRALAKFRGQAARQRALTQQ